jgi:hypothetical protein
MAGLAPEDYSFGSEANGRGGDCAVIRARVERPRDFGTLSQRAPAERFRGGRVRLSALVRTDGAERCALWLRIDDADRRVLLLDNMHTRPIRGTTGWTRHECVLAVPAEAELLIFGLLLDGAGAAWLDEVVIEAVGGDVATTLPHAPAVTIR